MRILVVTLVIDNFKILISKMKFIVIYPLFYLNYFKKYYMSFLLQKLIFNQFPHILIIILLKFISPYNKRSKYRNILHNLSTQGNTHIRMHIHSHLSNYNHNILLSNGIHNILISNDIHSIQNINILNPFSVCYLKIVNIFYIHSLIYSVKKSQQKLFFSFFSLDIYSSLSFYINCLFYDYISMS